MPESKPRPVHEQLEPLIVPFRGHRVVLDADLARLYGVPTKALNQSVSRNLTRFPPDFCFRLTLKEASTLRSRLIAAREKDQRINGLTINWSQFVTSSGRHRGVMYRPLAFTEHGALMAANVLRSERAVQMSILAEIDQTLLQHDVALRDVYRKLQPLLAPPPEPSKRRIGF